MSTCTESHGRELRSCTLDRVRMAEVAMPNGLRLPDHTHDSDQLVFVLEGSYSEHWRGESIRLRPGSVIFRPAGESHTNDFDRGGVLALVVSYSCRGPSPLSRCREPIQMPPLLADLRTQVEIELRRDDDSSALALEGLGLLLAARVGRFAASGRRPPWIDAALRFIELHRADTIGLNEVAAAVEKNRATVAAGFRRYVGRSVGETIRGMQLRTAVERIRSSNCPLAEIAISCGFHDQAHMGRIIKRSTGHTPGELRRRR